MKTSSNLLRRIGLALLGLGVVASAGAFVFILNSGTGLPIKWQPGNVPLRIMLGSSTTLSDGSNYSTCAQTAAQAWNANLGSIQIQTTIVSGTPADNNDVNELGFSNTVFGRPFDSGVLAVTTGYSTGNERSEADIIVNKGISWDSYRGSLSGHGGATDLQRVVIHEMGHLLGLDHPDENGQSVNAIMNSRVSSVDALTADDIQGVQLLYGPPGVPANDAFANAVTITQNTTGTATVSGVNTNATKESGEPRVADNSGGRSVWWRWTAPSAGTVILDTRGSYYDTTLGVYTGTSVSALTLIAQSDDITDGVVQASKLTFAATAGTIYRIAVDGFNNGDQTPTDHNGADSGGITLTLNFTSSGGGSVPIITTQPASVTVTSGNSASFSVVATSTPAATFQWLFNGTAIAGATSATYSISSTSTTQAGTYSVTVINTVGSVTSDGATLTVNTPAPAPTPTPTPSSGGGGGGGAPSLWFYAVLAALCLRRFPRFSTRA